MAGAAGRVRVAAGTALVPGTRGRARGRHLTAAPAVSVVVCTRDRAHWLDGCLRSVCAQEGMPFEVVVVDNGSADGTSAVALRHGVRVVHEPRVGLSRARNVGLAAASAPVVAFLDDDAVADPGWLAALVGAHDASPGASAVGGPIRLSFPAGRPSWLSPALEPWYSALDLGPSRRVLGPDESLYGANFSVRRTTAIAAGGFDPRLGRVGRQLRSGEEWALLERMRTAGPVVYEPSAGVTHLVLPERSSVRWLLRRAFAQGLGRPSLRSDGVATALRRAGRGSRSGPLVEELADRTTWVGEAYAHLRRALHPGP